ncbi:MAG TPA: hypothetical protein VGO91_03425, partial [Pyrinomonadaceae bacterium]|nr:hypothetical protein [Pyrinomonadaceae bacterium]
MLRARTASISFERGRPGSGGRVRANANGAAIAGPAFPRVELRVPQDQTINESTTTAQHKSMTLTETRIHGLDANQPLYDAGE